MNIEKLDTEKINQETLGLDTYNAFEICQAMNREDGRIADAIHSQLGQIAKVVEVAAEVVKHQGRVIYIGAGTSGRLGLLDAVECPPTFGVSDDVFIGLIAGGESAFIKAVEGAEDDQDLAVSDLKRINLCNDDMVIGVAASGRTPYVIGGLEYAKEVGAVTSSIAITNNSLIAKHCMYPIEVSVGAEVLTGSTRLKAGTAQKMVLNMISTGVMVLNGKVYKNLMVDVQQTNLKLKQRALNIIVDATDCSSDEAKQALSAASGSVKLAIVMILFSASVDEAKLLLANSNGFIKNIKI